jgi:glycosyltransferase involved in cell wall biosynthesis
MPSKTTIIVPCFNEATRLDTAAFISYMRSDTNTFFLFVDDGSSDNTIEVLREIKKKSSGFASYLQLPKNVGKAEAVRQGILVTLHEQPDYLGFWDADLATPLSEIPHFSICFSNDNRLAYVCGARIKRMGAIIERNWYRHCLGRIIATLISFVLDLPTHDTQCGAKIFTRELAQKLFEKPFLSTWLFDVELLVRILELFGKKIANQMIYEFPLHTWRDVGASKVNPLYLFKVPFELVRIFWLNKKVNSNKYQINS